MAGAVTGRLGRQRVAAVAVGGPDVELVATVRHTSNDELAPKALYIESSSPSEKVIGPQSAGFRILCFFLVLEATTEANHSH
jgi:hypothetical protein